MITTSDLYSTTLRQDKWRDKFLSERKYFIDYTKTSGHVNALNDLRSILNDKNLLWDLKEIVLVDPYLTPLDILDTVVYCKKENIIIKCLTCISTINSNTATKQKPSSTEDLGILLFEQTKENFKKQLAAAIPAETDLELTFRTTYKNHGESFHDRYLIMKYNINKTRVWSLGTSINSLGKSHHIIQIVEQPKKVCQIIDEIWEETNHEDCLIYSNI